jgi:hypothetical protein
MLLTDETEMRKSPPMQQATCYRLTAPIGPSRAKSAGRTDLGNDFPDSVETAIAERSQLINRCLRLQGFGQLIRERGDVSFVRWRFILCALGYAHEIVRTTSIARDRFITTVGSLEMSLSTRSRCNSTFSATSMTIWAPRQVHHKLDQIRHFHQPVPPTVRHSHHLFKMITMTGRRRPVIVHEFP